MTATRKALTLAELLVVLALIGVLAPMLLPVLAHRRDLAQEARDLL
jgi:prepilin-type N-terminal cleavage/methylation domain-containing protein